MENKRIAVVDDNKEILYTVSEICSLEDWIVLPCENHKDVAAVLKEGGADLFLVDYHLPEVDGVDIVRMIRKKYPSVPVVVLTVEEQQSVIQRFMEAGATDYALKPIKAVDLLSRLRVHLQYQEKAQYFTNAAKGISSQTMNTISEALSRGGDYMEIEQIAAETGIAAKSVYRYLRYMQENNLVQVQYRYSDKPGRPRAYYKLA